VAVFPQTLKGGAVSMSRSACWCLSAILPLCCAAGLSAVAAVPRVNDEARFFSPAAVEKGDRKIGDIARQFHRELLIETAPGIPDRLQEKYKELGKRAFFEGWTRQRAEEAGIRGIYILICKTPSHLQIVVDRSTRQRAFTREDEDRLTRKTIELLSAHKNDDALLAAVDFVAATLADNSGRSGPLDRREHVGVGPVRPQPQAMPPLGGGANLFGGSSLSGWLCIAAAVFLGLWLLKSIFGAITGTGRSMGGMGGGGMGPGGMGPGGMGPGAPGAPYGPMGPGGAPPGNGMPRGAVPDSMEEIPGQPISTPSRPGGNRQPADSPSASRPMPSRAAGQPAAGPGTNRTVSNPFTPASRNNRPKAQSQAGSATVNVTDEPPTFIGPSGYDVNN